MNSSEQNLIKSNLESESSKLIELYAHGKLLISGEYLVLDGAAALAAPTKFGQKFEVNKVAVNNNRIYWNAYDYQQKHWLNLNLDKSKLSISKELESKESRILINLLDQCKKLNPEFLSREDDLLVETYLEFPNDWGLGSSSTLIYFLASWAQIDPYELLFNTMKGSGYDIACAAHNSSLLYQLDNKTPIVESVQFKPSFKDNLHFVHLNKKQNSRMAIQTYEEYKSERLPINEISDLSRQMVSCEDQIMFEGLMDIHEGILSSCLKRNTIKSDLFSDYNGSVKSLGAWGGDFVMVSRNMEMDQFNNYFNEKGYHTILSFDEIIL